MTIAAAISIALLTASAATPADSLLTAWSVERSGMWRVAQSVFDNPAVEGLRLPLSLTRVNAAFADRADSRPVNASVGKSEYEWSAGADTYTRYKQSVLAGSARYSNGRRHDVQWCETGDYDIVYPYVLADSVGGDMKREQYDFSGLYSCLTGRWMWGGRLAYRATLEYRDVDPRPRNVVGCLDASVGGAYIAGAYAVGVDADFRRYSQSNDIDFKSEMGVDKIFHLTGLVSHYVRFAGTGMSAHYRGYRYGVGAALYPVDGQGAFGRVHAGQFKFDNILTELNKLPMASATHRTFEASAGWMVPVGRVSWSVSGNFSTSRRHGRENIFGDATSGVYPVIDAIDMYADNATRVSVTGRLGVMSGVKGWWVEVEPEYRYHSTVYLNPRQLRRVRSLAPVVRGEWWTRLGQRWMLSARGGLRISLPWKCLYTAAPYDNELRQLAEITAREYELVSRSSLGATLGAATAYSLNSRLGLELQALWSYSGYHGGIRSNTFNVTFGLIMN